MVGETHASTACIDELGMVKSAHWKLIVPVAFFCLVHRVGNCEYTCEMDGIDTPCDSMLDGNSLCAFDYINHNSFVGEEEIDGVMVNHFHWTDPLAGVDMADKDIWITQDATNPTPVQYFASLTPFGQSKRQECERASDAKMRMAGLRAGDAETRRPGLQMGEQAREKSMQLTRVWIES
jgi:hypothetical protein